MDSERWHRIEALFDQALALPESERGRFVDGVGRVDPEVHRELAVLLQCAPTAGTMLRAAVVAEVRTLARDVAGAQVGRRIGPYRLLQLLGEGGMGAVYLAERDDARSSHRVAIKILPHAVGSPGAIARFRDERQILGALEHPNIVRLLGGGNTDDGLPYLVMERIEGTTITRYAGQRRLSVRARVALIRRVCAALQYAHQNLVVHRDIKPSNILVGADGVPKILDFGIAKLLAPVARFAREARTSTGYPLFTREYASPEQARGDAVSTATDVYSVGAVLYELVTGRPPLITTGGALEIVRAICEVEPLRPSLVALSGWRRELAGDLDNIILRALHKDPARRYASAEQLSDDLGRWLEGLPVAARTSTFGYRARKFVRRNKVVVIATTLVASTLLAATVVSLRQAQRADEQAARAELEARNAIEAVRHARTAEAERRQQIDILRAEQSKLARTEAELQAANARLRRSQQELESAYAAATAARERAEQESGRARDAEARARTAAWVARQNGSEARTLYLEEIERRERAASPIIQELRPLAPRATAPPVGPPAP